MDLVQKRYGIHVENKHINKEHHGNTFFLLNNTNGFWWQHLISKEKHLPNSQQKKISMPWQFRKLQSLFYR